VVIYLSHDTHFSGTNLSLVSVLLQTSLEERLERIDAITGGRERTEAFLEQAQGNGVVSLSFGMRGSVVDTFGVLYAGIIDANAYSVPASRGVLTYSSGIVDLVRSNDDPVTRSTQMVKYYDDRRDGDPAYKRLKPEQFDIENPYEFRWLNTREHPRYVMQERVVLDGDGRVEILGAVGLSDVPRRYFDGIYRAFPDRNVTFTHKAAGNLVDALQNTRHPMGRGISLAVVTALQLQDVALANS
jgi:hypothetical protein